MTPVALRCLTSLLPLLTSCVTPPQPLDVKRDLRVMPHSVRWIETVCFTWHDPEFDELNLIEYLYVEPGTESRYLRVPLRVERCEQRDWYQGVCVPGGLAALILECPCYAFDFDDDGDVDLRDYAYFQWNLRR